MTRTRIASVRTLTLVAATAAAVLASAGPVAAAPAPNYDVLTTGLNAPFGIDASGGSIYVAEQASGRILKVNPGTGAATPVMSGLNQPAAVAVGDGFVAAVTSGSDVPDTTQTGFASLFIARPGGTPRLVADLQAYELANNPDGQLQFDPVTGEPLDALSNPFGMTAGRGNDAVLIADGGANDVLAVSRTGQVRTFFVPPTVNTGACKDRPNNDPQHPGCDSVPTGVAYGPRGTVLVSALTGEAPGEGRVYVLEARTGRQLGVITGLDSPTGVAVAPNGTVYVSEVQYNAPAGDGPPPADFNPASIGRIVKISPYNGRTYAAVPMPTGLDFAGGKLYASAWSIAGFLGIQDAGQVVEVPDSAFVP